MKSNNQINVPLISQGHGQVQDAFLPEVGVNLTNGYNGHLTSREASSVGGQMVNRICAGRTKKFERVSRISAGYVQNVKYIASIII